MSAALLDAALVQAYDALWARDGAGAMAALQPWLETSTTTCNLAQTLSTGIANTIRTAGSVHHFQLDGDISDIAHQTITAIIVAVGNNDHDGACHLFHTLNNTQTAEVIAGLVHIVATIAEPNS